MPSSQRLTAAASPVWPAHCHGCCQPAASAKSHTKRSNGNWMTRRKHVSHVSHVSNDATMHAVYAVYDMDGSAIAA
jgi:hypothetical protein